MNSYLVARLAARNASLASALHPTTNAVPCSLVRRRQRDRGGGARLATDTRNTSDFGIRVVGKA